VVLGGVEVRGKLERKSSEKSFKIEGISSPLAEREDYPQQPQTADLRLKKSKKHKIIIEAALKAKQVTEYTE